jgi:hypothetical protein
MRILNILSGVAVLLITLVFGRHLLSHILVETSKQATHSAAVWAGAGGVVLVVMFSFIGGCLLLRSNR